MADLVERADDDITRLLAQLVKAHPGKALRVLLETGALQQVAWRYEAASAGAGRKVYGYLTYFAGEAGHYGHEPVYRLADEESTRG